MPDSQTPELHNAPAYAEMIDDILGAIESGALQAGHRLASEPMLKEQYGISVNSIKRGLGLLVDRGVLTRRQGSGTFVKGTERASPPPLVRRDTVAVVRYREHWRYHPFFSEQTKGVAAGLARQGWKMVDLHRADEGDKPPDRDYTFSHLSPALVGLELERRPEVAGVICVQSAEQDAMAIADYGQPVVTSGHSEHVPYVCYDWPAETERLFQMALAKGARALLTVSMLATEELQRMCQRQARALGLGTHEVRLICLRSARQSRGAELVNQAYHLTLDALREGHDIEGLIVTSDFEAQGVTDALTALPGQAWDKFSVLALLNKESKLNARVPMTVLISDGYACGLALAELMHEHIVNNGDGRRGITLSCHQEVWH